MSNLKQVMDKYTSHLTIDEEWLMKLTRYYYRLFTKDDNTLSFFGDGLWGVYPIYFVPNDATIWYDDVLEIDDVGLKREVHALEDVVTSRHISSDIMNLTLLYFVHRILASKLKEEVKIKYCTQCLNILHYKFLSSLQIRRFKYNVDKSIAVAVYSRLTRKFLIKVCGSWKELLEYRAKDIIDKKGIHYKTLMSFNDDIDVIKMVNDIQNRIRKMINALTDEFYKVRKQDKTIGVRSKIISDEEGERISDSLSQYQSYRRYLLNVAGDRRSLVKNELVDIVEKTTSRLPKNALDEALYWISDNSHANIGKKINEWLDNSLEYAFTIMRDNRLKTNQLTLIIVKLRAMYLSSRVNDIKLMKIKEDAFKFIELGSKFKNKSVQITLRSAIMLYVVLRALVMKHYD